MTDRVPARHFRAALAGASLLALTTATAAAQTVSSPTGPSITQTPAEVEPDFANGDEVIATGTFIPNEKRITSEITSVLDEDIFAQIGAGDIANALTRVTGVSIAEGKFPVVRGLNERYSYATLNGGSLPSPEPLRRVAPLDLFPTSVLSDVTVQKTYSPEFSGEFGGGAIFLRTRAIPTESFTSIALGTSANTETTLRNGFVYEGSDTDWLGFDDGLRDLPDFNPDGTTAGNFENFDTLLIERQTNVPFNGSARVSAGNSFELGGETTLGVIATVGYDNAWQTRRGADNSAAISGGDLVTLRSAMEESTQNDINLNGYLGFGLEVDANNTVQLLGVATRQSTAEARIESGLDQEGRVFRTDFTEWFEREVYLGQLLGEHFIPSLNDAEFTWRASYAVAGRDAPYERRVNYEDFELGDGLQFQFNRPGTNNGLRFSELDDETLDLGADLLLPFSAGGMDVDFKFGGAYLDKTRDSQQFDFRYFGSIPGPLRNSRIDQIFSDAVFDAGILEVRRGGTTGFPDISDAALQVIGGYGQFDVTATEDLRLSFGARFETSEQDTAIQSSTVEGSFFRFDTLEEDFFLPAATLTYTVADSLQLRLAASRTINRPQFRELTPSIFVNTDTDDRFVGNPFLVNSESTNLDARVEYYFAPGQFVTVGGFYKDLSDPIEEFIFNGLGDSNATSFINAPSAEVYGLELEFEKNFRFDSLPVIGSAFEGGERDLVLRANYTYTDSTVSADGDVFITPPTVDPSRGVTPVTVAASGLYTDGRRLQGQSNHLANVSLGVEDFERGWDAFLLLNYTSDRIRAVEDLSNGLPSIIEELPLSLDAVVNFQMGDTPVLGEGVEFGFKVTNILDDDYRATQSLGDNEVVIDSYDIGTTFSASIKKSF